jgi:hypothetical protein
MLDVAQIHLKGSLAQGLGQRNLRSASDIAEASRRHYGYEDTDAARVHALPNHSIPT